MTATAPYQPVDPTLAYCEDGDHWALAEEHGSDPWTHDEAGSRCCYCHEFMMNHAAATFGGSLRAERVYENARNLAWSVTCESCGVVVDEDSADEPVPYHDPHAYTGPGWHANDPDAPEPPEFYDGMLLCPACMDKTPRCGCRECDPD